MAGGIFEVQVNTIAKIHFSLVSGAGALVSGQAANIIKTLDDEAGVAAEAVTIIELGATGRYEASFTPTKSAVGGHRYFLRLTGPTPATDGSVLEFYVASWPSAAFSGLAGPLLSSLANLKEYLGGEASGANDALLTRLLAVASAAVEIYCGRTFAITPYSDLYDGSGTDTLVLRQKPIIGTPTVKEAGAALTVGRDPNVASIALILYPKSGMLRRFGGVFLPFPNHYAVDYSAGFSTIPAPVEQAAIMVASIDYKTRDHIDLVSKNVGQQSTAFRADLPAYVKDMLRAWRLMAMGIAA